MTTTLFVLGAIWMGLALVFCLALCAAAARPLPKCEAEEPLIEPQQEMMETVDDDACCVR
jgi:hypothetical protein